MGELLQTEQDYQQALARMDALWGADGDSDEGRELKALADLIEIYEERHYPSPPVDPVSLLEGYMDNLAIDRQSLAERLGVRVGYVDELLNRKRRFTSRVVNVLVAQLDMDRDWFHQDLLAEEARKARQARDPHMAPSRGVVERYGSKT